MKLFNKIKEIPSKWIIGFLFLCFIVSRVIILNADIRSSDVDGVYSITGIISKNAEKKNISMHEHLYRITKNTDKDKQYRRYFGYPPLGAYFLNMPNKFIDFSKVKSNKDYTKQYVKYYRGTLFFIDILIFILVLVLSTKLYSANNLKILLSGIIYLLGGAILYHLLYDRLDLVLLATIVLCYYFQTRDNYLLSTLFLTFGVFFKLFPIFLIPIWILGWVSTSVFQKGIKNSFQIKDWQKPIKALITLGVMSILTIVISIAVYGTKSFSFLMSHGTRGVQIESVSSLVVMIFDWFGVAFTLDNSFGSQNLTSSITSFLAMISPLLIVLGIGYVFYLMIKRIHPLAVISKNKLDKPISVLYPYQLALGYLLALIIVLITSKVLSTQYFILLLFFIAIVLPKLHISYTLIWVIILTITALIFPYLYFEEIVGTKDFKTFLGPTSLGKSLLFSRNILLILFFYLLAKTSTSKIISRKTNQ